MSKKIVLAKVPNAGLGNQLFVLLKALLYGSLHNLPVEIANYKQYHIGPYLRGEKTKRNYNDYFVFQKNIFSYLIDSAILHLKMLNKKCSFNPLLSHEPAMCVVFNKLPHWSDYFFELNQYRDIVKELFFNILKDDILQSYKNYPSPQIGIHIRMGDFRKLNENEDFAKVGAVRTPLNYFVDVINKLRLWKNENLEATIFSDGFEHELEPLLSMDNVKLAPKNIDIGDLLYLSKSDIIVTSAGSTFSYWSGFLSDAPIIMHPDHIHKALRLEQDLFEGSIDDFLKHKNS
ncbi:MAG: alpha-1,2-fucosyltransferase [Chitinophagales bacterium]|nr:alpha-1,2-fucosyltransferase [Chitinophagales bacterium]